jgi:hypothetical protein
MERTRECSGYMISFRKAIYLGVHPKLSFMKLARNFVHGYQRGASEYATELSTSSVSADVA